MFHFQNRTDKLICVRTSFTLPKKKEEKKTENERFGFLHSKKTQDKNHQSKKKRKKVHIEMLIFQFDM